MVPQIVAAEAYETRDEGRDGRQHQHTDWKPNDGWERSLFTAASTILTGIGFAALLLSTVSVCGFELDVRRGLLWGLAGFVCFAVAPALGLPPVPPGVPESDVRARQLWWVMTVAATAAGLFLIFAARRGWISPNRRRTIASAASCDRSAAGDRTGGRSRTAGTQLCARLHRRERIVLAGSGRGGRIPVSPDAVCALITGTIKENLRIHLTSAIGIDSLYVGHLILCPRLNSFPEP